MLQNAKDEIIKGNEAYKRMILQALKISIKGALKIADSNTTANYNLGNALYRKDNTDEAVEAYDNTIKEKPG